MLSPSDRQSTPIDEGQVVSCSFCKRDRAIVGKLTEGPTQPDGTPIYICQGCLERCSSILEQRTRPRGSPDSPAVRLALSFAKAMAKGEFDAAQCMLAPSVRDGRSSAELRSRYEKMTSYWTAPPDTIELISVDEQDASSPGREDHEVVWVFVAIDNVACSFLEAISVRVVREVGRHYIGEIVWGRP